MLVYGGSTYSFSWWLFSWRGHHKSQTTNLSPSITLRAQWEEKQPFQMNELEEGIRPAHPESSPFPLLCSAVSFPGFAVMRVNYNFTRSALAGWVNQSNWMVSQSLALSLVLANHLSFFPQQLYHYHKWYFDLHLHLSAFISQLVLSFKQEAKRRLCINPFRQQQLRVMSLDT